MKEKGLAPLLIVVLIAIAAISTTGVSVVYNNDRNPKEQIDQAKEDAQEDAKRVFADYREILDEINNSGSINAAVDQNFEELEKLRKQVEERVRAILARNFCDAGLEDIKEALLVAQDMRLLDMDGWDQLIFWSQDVVSAMAGHNPGLYSEPTWMEEVCSYDCRGFFDTPRPLRWQKAKESKVELAQRVQLAELARLLGMEDEFYLDIAKGQVDLKGWMSHYCPEKKQENVNQPVKKDIKAYSISFPSQTFISKSMVEGATPPVVTANITNMRAHTCDGIYSSWTGTMHIKTVIADSLQEKLLSDDDEHFSFELQEGDSKLEGLSVTLSRMIMIKGYFEGPETTTGTIIEGASECNN